MVWSELQATPDWIVLGICEPTRCWQTGIVKRRDIKKIVEWDLNDWLIQGRTSILPRSCNILLAFLRY